MKSKLLAGLLYLVIVGSGIAYAHPMWGIAVDKGGQVYFSDLITVWRIDRGGRLSVFRPKGAGHVHEIGIDAEGNILGAENTYEAATKKFFSAIWKMTPAGHSSYVVPLQESPPKGSSIWRDGAGDAYYVTEFPADSLLVLKRTSDDKVIPLVGGERAARDFRQTVPYGIGPVAFGADGELFFTHGPNVSKVSRDGRMTTIAKNVLNEADSVERVPTSLYGIAIDATGNAVVADYGNRRVFRIASQDNRITTLLRSDGLWYPTGVATRGGDIYVLEIGHTVNHEPVGTRVRKLSPDGNAVVLATVDTNSAAKAAEILAEPDVQISRTEVTGKTEGPARIPRYPLLMVAAVFGVALSVAVWKKGRKFRKGRARLRAAPRS